MRVSRILPVGILLSSLLAARVTAQPASGGEPLSARVVAYRINVSLDMPKRQLHGTEDLTWTNPSSDLVKELRFHLYINAFRSSETTVMTEAPGRRGEMSRPSDWGWIAVRTMTDVATGTDLTGRMEFIQPDDGNIHDQTVLRVTLPRPVRAHQSITLHLTFDVQMPMIVMRTGISGEFVMAGQWFPKIGVYEPAKTRFADVGQWNCHQFHANTEFYADFGVYDVDITVPREYVVGATGVPRGETIRADGTKTLSFHAADVHDFAWTASPIFEVVEDHWKKVKIRLLTPKDRIGEISERYIRAMKTALKYYDNWLMPYPYEVITVVDPPLHGEGADGMEYPTLITGGFAYRGLPSGVRSPEMVVIHEFGHQYWYGMVANNEFEEAFLDEGFNQYSETRVMDHAFGKAASVLDVGGMKMGDAAMTRDGYIGMPNPKIAPLATFAWKMPRGAYGSLTYMKTATVLYTLDGLVGRDVMDDIMRTYFDRWKFRHPCVRDFISVVNEVVRKHHGNRFGDDMNWFFDETFFGSETCDYAASGISNSLLGKPNGVVDTTSLGASPEGGKSRYDARVTVSRLGEVKLPVDVLVRFSDGSVANEAWDGQDRVKEFHYMGPARAVSVEVDPDGKIPLDVRPANNSFTLEPETTPFAKAMVTVLDWCEDVMTMCAFF
jgi:hypothetical protein